MPSAGRIERTFNPLAAILSPGEPLAPDVSSLPPATDSSGGDGRRVLVGGVGYTNLRDMSAGPLLIERLQRLDWPPEVVVADLSYGPIDVLFQLQAVARFSVGVFLAAVDRGLEPGTVTVAPWRGRRPSADELQRRIGEAVTGVVSLENLLMILDHFDALPRRTLTVEVQPSDQHWGPDLSRAAEAALQRAQIVVRDLVERARAGAPLP